MDPEIFLEQQDIPILIQALNRFATKVCIADYRLDILINAGVTSSFISDLKLDAKPMLFANALVAKFRDYRAIDQRSGYHPMVKLFDYLLEIYEFDDQDLFLFKRLVNQGQENFKALVARNTVGRIESPLGHPIGSGVFIGKRFLLTSSHIFSREDEQPAWVRFNHKLGRYGLESGEVFKLDLKFISRSNHPDYALLRIEGGPVQCSADLSNSRVDSGQTIRLIHYPQDQPATISEPGHIVQVGSDYIDHDISSRKGSSGGPILDKNWRTIAIHRGYPGIGRSLVPGTTEGIPLYAIWERISLHLVSQ